MTTQSSEGRSPQTDRAGSQADHFDPQERANRAKTRIAAIGIPKQELAQLAKVDRGTLHRALQGDERIVERTWVKIERALVNLEEEVGIAAGGAAVGQAAQETASGETVTSTVEYAGARITLAGRADAVADAIRRVLEGE